MKNTLSENKYVKIMFDWDTTGIWDINGNNVPVEYATTNKILQDLILFWRNSQFVKLQEHYSQEREVHMLHKLGMDNAKLIAIHLKEEHPSWQVVFFNGGYFKENDKLKKNSYLNLEIVL